MTGEHGAGPGSRRVAETLLPPAFFTLLTVVAFHPLAFHLGDRTLPGNADKYIFLWDLWWVKHALATGQPLFHTDLVFAPEGSSLAYHTLTMANGLLGILLGSASNLLLAHNLIFLLSFILGGWFTFLLVRELGGSRVAGLLAGTIFAFAHPVWRYVFQCQMNLICRQWLPLLLLLVLVLMRTGRLRTGLWIGIVAALIFYTSLQQVLFAGLLLAPMVVQWAAQQRSKPADRSGKGMVGTRSRPAGDLSGRIRPAYCPAASKTIAGPHSGYVQHQLSALLIAVVVSITLAAPMLVEMARSRDESGVAANLEQVALRSTPLEHVLYDHATGRRFWNSWPDRQPARMAADALEQTVPRRGPLFGFMAVAVLVAGFGFALRDRTLRRPALVWGGAALPLLWLMLGPRPEPFGIPIPSLHLALFHVPGFSAIRFPSRFVIPLTLVVAVLAGLGWTAIERRLLAGRRHWILATVAALVIPLLFVEYCRAPFRLIDLHQPPAIYHQLRANGPVQPAAAIGVGSISSETSPTSRATECSLLELPFWASGAYFIIGRPRYETTWFQTVHQLPRVGGHISRAGSATGERLRRNRALALLSDPKHLERLATTAPPGWAALVEDYHVRFVNVDRTRYTPEQEKALHRLLEECMGAMLIAKEEAYLTYWVQDGSDTEPHDSFNAAHAIEPHVNP